MIAEVRVGGRGRASQDWGRGRILSPMTNVADSQGQPGTLSASTLQRDNTENRSYLQGTALNVAAHPVSPYWGSQ
jgi:hypothetical protein